MAVAIALADTAELLDFGMLDGRREPISTLFLASRSWRTPTAQTLPLAGYVCSTTPHTHFYSRAMYAGDRYGGIGIHVHRWTSTHAATSSSGEETARRVMYMSGCAGIVYFQGVQGIPPPT